jgi:hypothetical protein
MPMLVNGKQLVLPVVHCRGTLKRDDDAVDVEMTVLNDPENPMDLAKRVDDTQSTTVRRHRLQCDEECHRLVASGVSVATADQECA